MGASQFVAKRLIIALPFLIMVYLVFGINDEHGDINAGSMYPLVWIIPGAIISSVSYILYFLTDKLTQNKKYNFLKLFGHLILGISLLWMNEGLFVVTALTLPAILLINLVIIFYHRINNAK